MTNLNDVTVEGFITGEPLVKKLSGGKTVCHFSLTCHHDNREGKEHNFSFFDVEAWEKTAEICAEQARKGKWIILKGQLRQDRWLNKEGQQRSKVKLICSSIRSIASREMRESEKAALQTA
jgi:single-strand DNA-binding protein